MVIFHSYVGLPEGKSPTWIMRIYKWVIISMVYLWYIYGISMVYLWYIYGISMVSISQWDDPPTGVERCSKPVWNQGSTTVCGWFMTRAWFLDRVYGCLYIG